MAPSPAAVIVMAAGQGTRMRSTLPKVLHQIGGKTLLDHAVSAARGVHPENLIVVVRHQRDRVVEHLREVAPDVTPADQDDIPGTGRAVACGLMAVPEDVHGAVVVTSGDAPLMSSDMLSALIDQHVANGDAATLLTAVLEDPTGYGRVIRQPDGRVSEVVEQRDATPEQLEIREANVGFYVFDIDYLREALSQLGTDNAQGEVYLTDIAAHAYRAGKRTSALVATDHWLVEGCNDRAQLAALGDELNRRTCAAWMAQGVGIEAPCMTRIDVTATLAQDVTLEPGVLVRGTTEIGEGAQIGAYSILTDAVIDAGAVIPPHSHITSTTNR